MLNFKKALPIWSAFFLAYSLPIIAACPAIKQAEPVHISHIYDGDTVRLKDGRRIRIIGINTPEMGRDGAPNEAYALEAKQYLQSLLRRGQVKLVLGKEHQDRYKRWLGHLLVGETLVAESMLQQGLGFQVVVPPNNRFWRCLNQAQSRAERQGLGVWSLNPWQDVTQLQSGEGGFRLLKGRVTKVKLKNSVLWLDIDQVLKVRMDQALKPEEVDLADIDTLVGRSVRLSGWLKLKTQKSPKHFKPWFMSVKHPQHVRWE